MSVQLKSKEGEAFDVPLNVIKCASNITYVMEKYNAQGPFPLPRISSIILQKVITWAEYHKNDPVPREDDCSDKIELTVDDIDSWDAKFLNVDSATMAEIMAAATCLGIEALFDTCEVLCKMTKMQKTSE